MHQMIAQHSLSKSKLYQPNEVDRDAVSSKLSPKVKIETVQTIRGPIHVVRDDLLGGGTKQRAALPYLRGQILKGYREFVYASPFCGFAQIALADACRKLEVPCTIFVEFDHSNPTSNDSFHEFSLIAKSLGARLVLTQDLREAGLQALDYCENAPSRLNVPLGFDCPTFRSHMVHAVTQQWSVIREEYGIKPNAVWLPLGSGTLASTFREALPSDFSIKCINVNILGSEDSRIKTLANREGVEIFSAPEKFIEPSEIIPPFPSNTYYDAKLWRFVCLKAMPGDLLWNVAR
jgi:hypothetical protein